MKPVDRRQFVASSVAAGLTLAVPRVITASRTGKRPVFLGQGEFEYEFIHDWPFDVTSHNGMTTSLFTRTMPVLIQPGISMSPNGLVADASAS